MRASPSALPAGSRLGDRYTLQEVLGQGGFATTYVAWDDRAHDRCVLKELAPEGCLRRTDGSLDWGDLGDLGARRLQHQFRREIETLRRLKIPGVVPIRDAFQSGGTVWLVMDFFPASHTLAQRLHDRGPASVTEVEGWCRDLLTTLELVHKRGVLHRDLKPSNVLIDERDHAWLIDFGAARELGTSVDAHTVLFTPGFAPPEQLSPDGRRGPATDLYGLAATLWTMLAGSPPPDALARVGGVDLPDLLLLRPEVPLPLLEALEACLALPYDARPPTAEALRALVVQPTPEDLTELDLETLTERLEALRTFRPGKRECPSCHHVLEDVRPLAPHTCPVCREARLQRRKLIPNQCPHCRQGFLRRVVNGEPLLRCPSCRVGRLKAEGLPIPFRPRRFLCEACGEGFVANGDQVTRGSDRETATWTEWRTRSARSATGWECDQCAAQYDETSRGRRVQVVPPGGDADGYYADEWDRLAAGLDPGAGNSECPGCGADFDEDDQGACLLDAPVDPYGLAESLLGRHLDWETLRWLGAGKSSGHEGRTCERCGTEFDGKDGPLVLVRTPHERLRQRVGGAETLADWHRLARDLPRVGEEAELMDLVDGILHRAFQRGNLAFDDRRPQLDWKGGAVRYEPDAGALREVQSGTLTVDAEGWRLGGALRAKTLPLASIHRVFVSDGRLYVEAGKESWILRLEPVEIRIDLPGKATLVRLTEADLVPRWHARLALRADAPVT